MFLNIKRVYVIVPRYPILSSDWSEGGFILIPEALTVVHVLASYQNDKYSHKL